MVYMYSHYIRKFCVQMQQIHAQSFIKKKKK